MASTADLAAENIEWRILSMDPAHSGRPFLLVDPDQMRPEDLAGGERLFWVEWNEETLQEGGVTDIYERIAVHEFDLRVLYSRELELRNRRRMMVQDRHDIIKTLRDTTLFTGYSAATALTDIGLHARWVRRVERTEEIEGADVMTYTLECSILESEI